MAFRDADVRRVKGRIANPGSWTEPGIEHAQPTFPASNGQWLRRQQTGTCSSRLRVTLPKITSLMRAWP